MMFMIVICFFDRKNLDVSCIIMIVIVKYFLFIMFYCCIGMFVQFIINVVLLRKIRRKYYELCYFD